MRADLHIHRHSVSDDVTDERMIPTEIVAEARRKGISAVAFTDHNSADALEAVVDLSSSELLVLPGAEIATTDGHLLALFAPASIDALRALLVELEVRAVASHEVATTKSMADALQAIRRRGGIGIAAHTDRGAGIEKVVPGYGPPKKSILLSPALDGLETHDAGNSSWYTSTDPDSNRYQLIRERERDAQTRWHPEVARVRFSDAHSLPRVGEAPDGSSRLTRIKLSDLTFEGVRVAFRDPSARIRLEDEASRYYPRLMGIACTGGLLDGLLVRFSSNLTSLIGGRGTGKSTLLETIRWVLGHDVGTFASQARAPVEATLYIELSEGVVYRLSRVRDGVTRTFDRDGTEVADISFEVEAYGQGTISKITETSVGKRSDLIAFFDQFVENLADQRRRLQTTGAALDASDQELVAADTKTANYDGVVRDLAGTEARLKAAEEGKLRDVVELRTAIESSERLRSGITDGSLKAIDSVRLAASAALLPELEAETLLAAPPAVQDAVGRFRAAVEPAISEAVRTLEASRVSLLAAVAAWREAEAPTRARVLELTSKLEGEGLKADLAHLQGLLERRTSLANMKTSMEAVRAAQLLEDRAHLVDQTRSSRVAHAAALTETVRAVLGSGQVRVRVLAGDFPLPYFNLLLRVAKGSSIHERTLWRLAVSVGPADLRALALDDNAVELATRPLGSGPNLSLETANDLIARLRGDLLALNQLEHIGQDDGVEIAFRSEGGEWQQLQQLSQGQRHTILLSIAFGSGRSCPLLIDQPEDELDNAFVFDQVVRTLRNVKERRQVIVVSHNANVVVLGDAELIYVMDRVGDLTSIAALGSMDTPAIKKSALRLLSGGEAALRRRSEMYGL